MSQANNSEETSIPRGTQTLARGLAVLQAVARGAETLKQVVDATLIGRSTAHRLLQLLEREGYVERRQQLYVLGPALIEFGFVALSQNPLPVVARPILEGLRQKYQDTVHLGIRDSNDVLYLDKVAGSRGVVSRSRIGHRMPLTRTGIGKALILDDPASWEALHKHDVVDWSEETLTRFIEVMNRYRSSGYAQDLEENEQGIRCVAAPVRNASGRIVAGISMTAARQYFPPARMQAVGPVILDAARSISRKLGHVPE